MIGFSFHLSAIEDVDHEALHGFCTRGAHAPNCSGTDCDGYLERLLCSIETSQHVYVR